MWSARHESVNSGRYQGWLIRLYADQTPLSRQEFFCLLVNEPTFADWYTGLLSGLDLAAYFWEFPPLLSGSMERITEFAVIGAPALEKLRPEPAAFNEHFAAADDTGIVEFSSLGGDALLIAPTPGDTPASCAHLADFLRNAERDRTRALWSRTATAAVGRLTSTPLWLSTSGLGVAWLHVRLDSRPKYYQYAAYKNSAA